MGRAVANADQLLPNFVVTKNFLFACSPRSFQCGPSFELFADCLTRVVIVREEVSQSSNWEAKR